MSGNSGTGGQRFSREAWREALDLPSVPALSKMEQLHDLRRLIRAYPEQAAQFLHQIRAEDRHTPAGDGDAADVDR